MPSPRHIPHLIKRHQARQDIRNQRRIRRARADPRKRRDPALHQAKEAVPARRESGGPAVLGADGWVHGCEFSERERDEESAEAGEDAAVDDGGGAAVGERELEGYGCGLPGALQEEGEVQGGRGVDVALGGVSALIWGGGGWEYRLEGRWGGDVNFHCQDSGQLLHKLRFLCLIFPPWLELKLTLGRCGGIYAIYA